MLSTAAMTCLIETVAPFLVAGARTKRPDAALRPSTLTGLVAFFPTAGAALLAMPGICRPGGCRASRDHSVMVRKRSRGSALPRRPYRRPAGKRRNRHQHEADRPGQRNAAGAP